MKCFTPIKNVVVHSYILKTYLLYDEYLFLSLGKLREVYFLKIAPEFKYPLPRSLYEYLLAVFIGMLLV